MKKVRHQVMHRTQVTPNAIWKHCELRNDLYFYNFYLHALPGCAFLTRNSILNLKQGSKDTSTQGKNANYKA